MLSGANAFEISDIQEERTRETVLTKRPECNVTLRRKLLNGILADHSPKAQRNLEDSQALENGSCRYSPPDVPIMREVLLGVPHRPAGANRLRNVRAVAKHVSTNAQSEKKQEILDFLIEVFLSRGLLVYRGEFSLEHR
jgi:hypothetical protein